MSGQKFRLQLAAAIAHAKQNADQLVRKVVLDVGTRVVERSPVGDRELWAANSPEHRAWRVAHGRPELIPVGYIGGRFRANWQYGNLAGDGIPMTQLDDIDPTGQVSVDRIASGISNAQSALGTIHYILNNLPYAQRLEDGWSKQAPQGMVGLTVLEYQGIVDNAAREVNP